jgi:triosephosphate isomerase
MESDQNIQRRLFIGGNWKCNGDSSFLKSHINTNINTLSFDISKLEVVIAPTFLHLYEAKSLLTNKNVSLAAQNVCKKEEGAYTGEVSCKQLLDYGINWVIIGHSERRTLFSEDSTLVGEKVKLALDSGLNVIACIGENKSEREANKTFEIVTSQLFEIANLVKSWDNVVIAYEPVWAIGTGITATPEQAEEVHFEIRSWLEKNVGTDVANKTRIIYGGSVTDSNSADLIKKDNIDGFLIGGASLKGAFKKIVESAI